MATLWVRFIGMCAFVSDKLDISKATQLYVVMPDVQKAIRSDPHFPTLTFNVSDHSSGGESAQAIPAGNGDFLGAWPLAQRWLVLLTQSTTDFKTQNLDSIASIKDAGYESDVIDNTCLSAPSQRPVSALMKISKGEASCSGPRPATEVLWALEFSGKEVTFGLFGLDDTSHAKVLESLTLKLQEGVPVEITISDLSVPSLGSGAVDHPEAYGSLLKSPIGILAIQNALKTAPVGGGVGCQPTRMVMDGAA